MKTHIFVLMLMSCLFSVAGGCSKHKNSETVPKEVIVQFDTDHQQADKVYWEPAEKGFQATFKDGGIEKVAFYTKDARPLRVEYEVAREDVPVVVVTRMQKRYPKAEIEHITYVERPNGKPYYSVRARDPQAVFSLEINPRGVVLKRVVLENLVIVKNHPGRGHDRGHGHGHCKHKHKKGKGHGNGHCKHDHDEKPGIVIRL